MSTVVFGWYGHNNFGDELILASLLHQIGREDVVVFSDDPEHTRRTHNVYAVQWRRSDHRLCWRTILRHFARAKRVIVGGGGLWNDNHPRNILYYAGLPLIAAIMGCQVESAGVGVDAPIKRRTSKIILRLAERCYKRIEVRDRNSQRFLSRDASILSDLGCDLARKYPYHKMSQNDTLPFISQPDTVWALSPKASLEEVKKLIESHPTWRHTFISCFDYEDLPIIQKVAKGHRIVSGADFQQILSELAHASVVISSRLHPLIVADELGIPSIALSDEPKFVNICH